jgi:hypothetical protein
MVQAVHVDAHALTHSVRKCVVALLSYFKSLLTINKYFKANNQTVKYVPATQTFGRKASRDAS